MFQALLAIGLFLSTTAFAYENEILLNGQTLEPVTVDSIASQIPPGTVVIVSEFHDLELHHDHQVAFLEALATYRESISLGMEFFSRTHQAVVDSFLHGKLAEADFLKAVEWGNNNFDFYRRQVLFPINHEGTTLALNAPRELTGKIAKSGLASLTDEERAQLPAGFTLGNDEYKARFREAMGGHEIPEEKFNNYFAAQSTWDETMSDTACTYMQTHPTTVLTILVGDFHAAYGGGLPDRLRARGCPNVVVISQTAVEDLSDPSKNDELRPHPRWGKRADFIWAVEIKEAALIERLRNNHWNFWNY